jgi:Fasciclin domain
MALLFYRYLNESQPLTTAALNGTAPLLAAVTPSSNNSSSSSAAAVSEVVFTVNSATVTTADITALDGVLHIIDTVMVSAIAVTVTYQIQC